MRGVPPTVACDTLLVLRHVPGTLVAVVALGGLFFVGILLDRTLSDLLDAN